MKKILMPLLGVILLTSCNPAQQAYNDLEAFTEYLENYSDSFTKEDMDNAIIEYSTIIENVDTQVYTEDEYIAIGKLKGRCAVQFAKLSIRNTEQKWNNILLEAEGFIQSIVDEFSNENIEQ